MQQESTPDLRKSGRLLQNGSSNVCEDMGEDVCEEAMKTQREELDEARMDNYPPCKNCNHPGESHDEEFGTCDFSGLTQTGWQICDCPGYEEGEDWEVAFANYPIAS